MSFLQDTRVSCCCVLAALSVGACATAEPYNPEHLAADDRNGIMLICKNVIGLQQGEEHFDACMESLSMTERGLVEAAALTQARAQCLEGGAAPGTVALAECELRPAAARAARPAAVIGTESVSKPARSYFMTSNEEVFQRERLACARLGVDPVDSEFGSCVADLQASLFAADHPMQ